MMGFIRQPTDVIIPAIMITRLTRRRLSCALGAAALSTLLATHGLPVALAARARRDYREIDWDALLPPHWVAEIKSQMAAIGKMGFLIDGTEAADEAMRSLRQKWDNAPIDPSHIDQAIRIAGYVVRLDAERRTMREFLLVPYFGACIHLPPPPANQIILVRLARPESGVASMDTVWVEGTLREARVDTGMAITGYALDADQIRPYEEKRQPRR
jgi:hypothetical protein